MTNFIIAYHISLVKVQTNYCNNNLLILDVKQLNKIMKFYYFHSLKALWDDQGKIKMYYGMPRVKTQLSGKRSIGFICFSFLRHLNYCPDFFVHAGKQLEKKALWRFDKVIFKIYNVINWKVNNYNKHIAWCHNKRRQKDNQTMKVGQLIECKVRKLFI